MPTAETDLMSNAVVPKLFNSGDAIITNLVLHNPFWGGAVYRPADFCTLACVQTSRCLSLLRVAQIQYPKTCWPILELGLQPGIQALSVSRGTARHQWAAGTVGTTRVPPGIRYHWAVGTIGDQASLMVTRHH